MIDRFVAFALERRALVLAAVALVAVYGAYAWSQLSIEAYPDIADVSSQVVTQYPGHAAEEVEQQITIPLERELNGIPGLQVMRSNSSFGLSLITLVFRDGVDDYWARQRIQERLAAVTLPPGASPELDPLTSPTGEVYRYTLDGPGLSSRELRDLQEWVVIPTLRQVPGVADVTNFGGENTQFLVQIDPARLERHDLSLAQVSEALEANNANAGGSVMLRGEQSFVVRGLGLIHSPEDIGNIVITQKGGTPIFVRDVATVALGALQRTGILGRDDNADGVSGIVLLLRHENASVVLRGIHEKVRELNERILPSGVAVAPYLDRTDLVETTLHRVSQTVLEGIGLVLLVLILFLGSVRGALLVAITIPLSMLIAFIGMHLTDIPANLLSLGAIDFGIIVDGAIVLMENILRRREASPERPLTLGEAREAAVEVARPVLFATLIIITAYLPLFAFERVEKKLFTPMAYTVGYALGGALLVALALIPALAYWAYRKPGKVFHNPVLSWLHARYDRVLGAVVERPRRALIPGAGAAVLALLLGAFLGRDFLPYLDEGSIWVQVQLPPGLSIEKSSAMADELRAAVRDFPEIATVVTQVGRNDDGTDPWTPSHIEVAIALHPYRKWGGDKQALIGRLDEHLSKLPGFTYGFSQPMIDGVNDKIAGAHSELVVKVFGEDFAETRRIAEAVAATLEQVPGAADVAIDQEPPLPQLQIRADRAAAARYGINVADVAEMIEGGIGGKVVGDVFLGERRYDLVVRYVEQARSTPEAIGNLKLVAPSGARVPLSEVAHVALASGESTITREMNHRHLTVKLNLRGRDLNSFLKEAEQKIAVAVSYDPAHYRVVWGGQFENQQRAQQRLLVIVPAALGLILLLLYAHFGRFRHALIILANLPLALLGGIAALHLRGMTLNVSSAVGFIALFGVAVQNGVIMVANLERWRRGGAPLLEAVRRGATERFRPVLMTATVATLGLLPAALARGVGSDVQRPLATVIVGGLATATILTLVVLPALYLVVERRRSAKEPQIAVEV
jgi:cobalt-zinc-cadmium resistance protein CzcA